MRAIHRGGGLLLASLMLTACNALEPPPATTSAAIPSTTPPAATARIGMYEVGPTPAPGHRVTRDRAGRDVQLLEPAFVTTADVAGIARSVDDNGAPVLLVEMKPGSADRILEATAARVGKPVAFVVGDEVLTVATVAGPFGQRMQVSGLESAADADRLFKKMTAPAAP